MWFLSIIGIFVFVGGVWQIRSYLFATNNNLVDAYNVAVKNALESGVIQNDTLINQATQAEALAAMQKKDTDNDGINDFEEQYIHGTSRYLADSDSDGIGDNTEISQSTDPNCPEGSVCGVTTASNANSTDTNAPTAAEQAFSDLNPSDLTPGADLSTSVAAPAIDVDQLRADLLANGVPQEVLDNTDDATLLKAYEDSYFETQGQSNITATIEQQADQYRNMSVEQKKQILLQAGVDKTTVDALDEATINSFFDQAINQAVSDVTQQSAGTTNENKNESSSSEDASNE